MAKSIAQRLTALEKTVAAFFTGSPRPRKAKAKRNTARKTNKSKTKKKTSRTKAVKAPARRKAKRGRRAAALPFPPG